MKKPTNLNFRNKEDVFVVLITNSFFQRIQPHQNKANECEWWIVVSASEWDSREGEKNSISSAEAAETLHHVEIFTVKGYEKNITWYISSVIKFQFQHKVFQAFFFLATSTIAINCSTRDFANFNFKFSCSFAASVVLHCTIVVEVFDMLSRNRKLMCIFHRDFIAILYTFSVAFIRACLTQQYEEFVYLFIIQYLLWRLCCGFAKYSVAR